MQPASRVVAKLGGPTKVAKIVGIHRTRVSAWQRPRASGGTDGRIPQDHHAKLLAFARKRHRAFRRRLFERGSGMNSIHLPAKELPARVLGYRRGGLRDTAWQRLHLDHETRDNHADVFAVFSAVGVKRKACATAAKQFDLCDSINVDVRHINRLNDLRRKLQYCHDPLPKNPAEYCSFGFRKKPAALQFYGLNKVGYETDRITSTPFSRSITSEPRT
jgi:hypothetical protein